MGGNRRDRQRASRQARLAAAAEVRRQAVRRRWMIGTAVVSGLVLLTVAVVALSGEGDSADVAATGTPTTGTPTTGTPTTGTAANGTPTSAVPPTGRPAGAPCVAVTDPLPAGAPAVPVKVGPPPATLVTEDLRPGDGAEVSPGATVTANYIGVACSTGKIFDSSYSRSQPITTALNEVIPGWQQGIPGMKVRGQRLLGIPPAMAYGAQGNPPAIGPNETLWFVVEVLDTKPA